MSELLVIIIALLILLIAAMPQYTKALELAKTKEAIETLNLIARAEHKYLLKNKSYYPPTTKIKDTTNIVQINHALKLSIPSKSDWNYKVISGVSHVKKDAWPYYALMAHRNGNGPYSSCVYIISSSSYINTTLPGPITSGNCP